MKKFIIAGFVVALLIVGVLCWQHFKHPSDARLSREVTGAWTHSAHAMTMNPDGSYSESFHYPKGTLTYAGTWHIKDGMLILTVTNASGWEHHEAVGSVDEVKIISVDAHHLVWEADGQEISLSR